MRIITGKFKGRNLTTVQDKSVRPATDRVKTTIFNMFLNRLSLKDIQVLDLFAGSGSLGFETISRGASSVTFVDDNEGVLDIIEENADMLGCISQTQIFQGDALTYIEKSKNKYDLIFADPPYSYTRIPDIPEIIFRNNLLNKNGYLIIEHSKHTSFPNSLMYSMEVQKEFGNTRVSFFVYPKEKGDEK
ncbi:MAG: 16S rRNA (guanine(966)-N(2))-methyltransferase RsmD [Ignavibacteriales bacterium]|nr:16S rRNA (guanine(966)-N(2))-methyltransferase RsmD [Ignavibacteriales bacterium]